MDRIYNPENGIANESLITAKEFYEVSLRNQRQIINRCIREAMDSGKNVVKLPFDTYTAIDMEMRNNGWNYVPYTDENGNRCAGFTPTYDEWKEEDDNYYYEEDEDDEDDEEEDDDDDDEDDDDW